MSLSFCLSARPPAVRGSVAPSIFWALLEERRQLLGLDAPRHDQVWHPALLGLLGLVAAGCAWVIPTLYQRLGSPFFFAAAVALQFPTLVAGSYLWADVRTADLGSVVSTIGACLTPLTVAPAL